MAVVKPFRAVRYNTARAGPLQALVAPPFDVIDPAERERYIASDRHNVVRLTLPDSEGEAARELAAWQREGILVRDEGPAFWWLSQDFAGPDGARRTRTGFVASVRVEPYAAGAIRPHERTHECPKAGRLRLLRATRMELEPIFLLYEDESAAPRRALEPLAAGEPLMEAADSGVTSRLWRVDDPEALAAVEAALADLPLLIADGHHRYETALAFHEEDSSLESEYAMAALVNTVGEGLTIFPTHRVVQRLGEVEGTEVPGGPLGTLARLDSLDREHPAAVLYRGGKAYLVRGSTAGELDAAFLERFRPEGVSYTPRAEEAVARVDEGEAEAAFLLRAPTIEQVTAVAAAGEVMPPKSTYFYPKLLSGLLFLPV